MRKNKSKVWMIVKIIIIISIIAFIYGCYKVDFLKNNKYVIYAKYKLGNAIETVTGLTGKDFASFVEHYEPDEEDNTVYEITDTQNRYYYNQLDDTSKIIYAEILKNIEKIKNGEDNIRISSKLSELASSDDMATDLMNSFQNAWDAFRNDNVDIFYIDGTKMCLLTKTITRGRKVTYEFYISKGNNKNYLIDGFNSAEEVNKAIKIVETEENKIINSITEKNDYYKIVKAHNWIVDNVEYNLEESVNNSNIYGALYDKTVVCEGYARLFKSLMDKFEIPCVLVSGVGIDTDTGHQENHAWNYVYLKGNWYAVDVTWDDPVIIGSGEVSSKNKYKYLLKGSDEFFKSHIEKNKLVDNGMDFEYPVISTIDYIKDE